MLVDTHAHLDDRQLIGQVESVLARARSAGVERVITVGADLDSSARAVNLAKRYEGVSAVVGIHPHEAESADDEALRLLAGMAKEGCVVGVGETGLDYYRDLSPRGAQRSAFERHLDLAAESGLPVVVHCRDAWDDCMAILERRAGPGLRGVAHCFTGDAGVANRLAEMGFFISFAGNITYPNAGGLRAVAAGVPVDKALVETDCPYLSPQPRRKVKPNEPAFVVHTAAQLAQVLGLTTEDAAQATTGNACRLFGKGGRLSGVSR